MRWWMYDLYSDGRTVELVSWIFWVIASITLHELAHGWAALWQGDDTPRRTGHLTANPFVHMPPMSMLMFAFVGIAWGLMPVDPSRFRWGRRGRIAVSGAGPAMNLLIACVALTLLALWLTFAAPATGSSPPPLYSNMALFLFTGGWLNILLAVFNLLPIPPLDGASVLSGLSLRAYQFFQKPEAVMFGMFVVLAVMFSGIGGLLFGATARLSLAYVASLLDLLGGPSVDHVLGGY